MEFLRSLLDFVVTCAFVFWRRLRHGPRRPTWGFVYEAGVEFLRVLTLRAGNMQEAEHMRQVANSLTIPPLAAVLTEIRTISLSGLPARRIRPLGRRERRVALYLHGGAYVFYVGMQDRLLIPFSRAARAETIVPAYRLAPEAPFPAAVEDALAAYQWLLEQRYDPRKIVLGGDSAGGGLAVAVLMRLRDAGLPQPALSILLSPWVDLTCSGESMQRNHAYDWINYHVSRRMAVYYVADQDPCHPLASPLHADLRGISPLYIQGGQAEVLHDQIHAFAHLAREQGVDVLLEMFPDMVHEFQAFDRYTPQSRQALTRIQRVIDQRLG